MNIHCALTQI